jgi:hypothetical protein
MHDPVDDRMALAVIERGDKVVGPPARRLEASR